MGTERKSPQAQQGRQGLERGGGGVGPGKREGGVASGGTETGASRAKGEGPRAGPEMEGPSKSSLQPLEQFPSL